MTDLSQIEAQIEEFFQLKHNAWAEREARDIAMADHMETEAEEIRASLRALNVEV